MSEAKPRFLVLYIAPPEVLADWAKTDPEVRRPAEEKMRADWGKWMGEHAAMIVSTDAGGATRRVTADGIVDINNGVMLTAVVEAASHEAAAKAFATHPHLQIPRASIEVMAIRPMGGM